MSGRPEGSRAHRPGVGPAVRGSGDSLVIDVGTSAVKAAVLDPSGHVVVQASSPLATHLAAGGVMEQDPEAWWAAATEAVEALHGMAATLSQVRRLVLTGQMQDLTLTDAVGQALRLTLLYGDQRAATEAAEVLERVAPDGGGEALLVARTGNLQDASGLLAKLLWLQHHEPDVLAGAERLFLGAGDLLAFRLTGEHVCDTTTASTTGLMDLDTRQPLPDALFDNLGLHGLRPRLPRFVPGGARVGVVSSGAGAATPSPGSAWRGLAGVPVHLAPGDAGATTVGAGSGEPGAASGYVGTSGWLSFSATARGDPAAGVFTLAHARQGRFVHIAPLLTAGGNLAWARSLLDADASPAGGDGFETLIERALARPPARLLYLPYLQGERSPFRDPSARGAFIGLTPDTNKDDLLRAVLEGVAMAYRHALEALVPGSHDPRDERAVTRGGEDDGARGDARGAAERQEASELVLTGGGTRSAAWCKLFATVLGRTVVVPEGPEAVGLRGALRCAQVADGLAPDFALPITGARFPPDQALRPAYDRLFGPFRDAHQDLRQVFGALARAGSSATDRHPLG